MYVWVNWFGVKWLDIFLFVVCCYIVYVVVVIFFVFYYYIGMVGYLVLFDFFE